MADEQKPPSSPAESVGGATLVLSPSAGVRPRTADAERVFLWDDSQQENSVQGAETVNESMDPTTPKKDFCEGDPGEKILVESQSPGTGPTMSYFSLPTSSASSTSSEGIDSITKKLDDSIKIQRLILNELQAIRSERKRPLPP